MKGEMLNEFGRTLKEAGEAWSMDYHTCLE